MLTHITCLTFGFMGDITKKKLGFETNTTHITRAFWLGSRTSAWVFSPFPLACPLRSLILGRPRFAAWGGGRRFLGWRLVGIGETPVLNEGETYGKISLKRGRFHWHVGKTWLNIQRPQNIEETDRYGPMEDYFADENGNLLGSSATFRVFPWTSLQSLRIW